MLPDSCLVYVNTHDFFELNKKINSQSLIIDKLQLFDEVNQFCIRLAHFDSLLTSNLELKEELEGTQIHFALYRESQWLLSLNIKELGKQEAIEKKLEKILGSPLQEKATHTFKLDGTQTAQFVLEAGVLLISNSKLLLKSALNSTRPKFENSKSYQEFRSNLTESNFLGIYVNQTLYLKNTGGNNIDLSAVTLKGFLAGTIDLEPSEIRSNGYLVPDSSTLFSQFLVQDPQKTDEVFDALPLNTISFQAYGFSSYLRFVKNSPQGGESENTNYWSNVNKLALYNVKNEFDENLANHLLVFKTPASTQFVCSQIKDPIRAANYLKFMSDTLFSIDSLIIYRLQTKDHENDLELFRPLIARPTKYGTLWGDYIYFADEEQDLRTLVANLKRKYRMRENENFIQYKNQYLAEEYNYLAYSSPAKDKEGTGVFFKFKNTTETDPFENFKHFSYSLTQDRKRFKYRFHVLHQTENKQKNTLWTLDLDTTATRPPNAFVNHLTKENEMVIQDLKNNLYLINAKGNKLWMKHLNESIISEIHLVDIFKNNKFQMLFNTRNYLYLIDRNGNTVEGYPVKLPSPASSALSVFDYEHTKDYRVFISCKNKMIYNYSIYGTKQTGFVPFKTEAEVLLPIQYLTVSESQYLVAIDKEGKIYTFSRKGIGRIGLRNRTVANCTSFYIDASNSINSTYLIYFDEKEGLINKISFDDRKEIVKIGVNLDSAGVSFNLVDDNRSMDIIITNGTSVKAYDFSGSLLLENSSNALLSQSALYKDESRSKLISYSAENATLEIFDLFDQTHKQMGASAMPLVSDLFKDNKKYLIFTNGKRLTCVLMN